MDNLIKKLLLLVLLIIAANAYSWDRQKVIGAPDSNLDGSSIFEVVSTTKGSTPSPKMTTGNRTAISTPDEGLHAWDTSLNIPYAYDGSSWDQYILATATQILTNKTFDADLNTLTNVENADIKALAGIDATKIHDGSTDNTEFGYLDGVTSSIQTQIDSKLGSSGFSGDRLLFTNASGAVDSSSDATYTKTTQILRILGDLVAGGRGEFRSEETSGGNYVGFRAPDTLAGNQIWDLPSADGTPDTCLKTNGSGVLDWTACSGGGGGAFNNSVVKQTSATLTTSENFIYCDATAGDVILTLPTVVSNRDVPYWMTKIDSSSNVCQFLAQGGETIHDDASSDLYGQYSSMAIMPDGTSDWGLMSEKTQQVAYLKDIKPSGTNGGTCTSGSYLTRDLNTLEGGSGWITLASDQFTLVKGVYVIEADAPGHQVDFHKIAIFNVADATNDILGSSELANAGSDASNTRSILKGIITIINTTSFELVHRCGQTKADNGYGRPSSFGDSEIYGQVKVTKVR